MCDGSQIQSADDNVEAIKKNNNHNIINMASVTPEPMLQKLPPSPQQSALEFGELFFGRNGICYLAQITILFQYNLDFPESFGDFPY